MRRLILCALGMLALGSLSGCVVYEPRPRVYTYDAYEVCPEPVVVYYGGYHGYYGGYHRACWR